MYYFSLVLLARPPIFFIEKHVLFLKGFKNAYRTLFIEVVLMKFKCRLKVILAEKDIPHGVFAQQVGINGSTLSSIIKNRSLPNFQTTYAICTVLNKKIEDIWILEEETQKSP